MDERRIYLEPNSHSHGETKEYMEIVQGLFPSVLK